MQFTLLKSKLHRASVTAASLDYEGSLTIAADLMSQAGFLEYERILVSNLDNGNRFETYIIRGEPGSGAIILNGATAHLGKVGDRLTIMSFTQLPPEEANTWKPKVLLLGEQNRVLQSR